MPKTQDEEINEKLRLIVALVNGVWCVNEYVTLRLVKDGFPTQDEAVAYAKTVGEVVSVCK